MRPVYILGGFQTDFARNFAREGKGLFEILEATMLGALASTDVDPAAIEVFHVGNFTGELFARQGHLGGFIASIHPDFEGRPTVRHEAACASGGAAVLSAVADIQAERYALAAVVGVELMRNVSGRMAANHLGAAAWTGREGEGARFFWPHMFGRIAEAYDARYGLDPLVLLALARNNFENAKRNPSAQARDWTFTPRAFTLDDEENPVVDGRVRKHDSSQITDGGAALILASPELARQWSARRGLAFERIPRIKGFGHRTAPMLLDEKLSRGKDTPYMFPHLRGTIEDAFRRAELPGVEAIDAIETHDCFTISEYLAIDHFGLTPPGESWRAIEDGTVLAGGKTPINPSGGLIGGGHPIGATGVRQVLDAAKQILGTAGEYQVPNARNVATLNIGGSMTTTISLVVGL